MLQGKRISQAEISCINVLLAMSPEGNAALAYHWQNFKPANSGVTISRLAALEEASKMRPRDSSNALFSEVLQPTGAKLEAVVLHEIGVFCANLKNAARSALCVSQ